MTNEKRHTDIVNHGWIGKIPSSWRPYVYLMRLDRPIGTWLLLLPSLWAIGLSGGALYFYALFAIGAVVMRAAGCVVNDLWDCDLDGRVERTATRPIPSGDLSVKQALVCLLLLLVIGLAILVQFNLLTIGLGVLSLIFVGLYPLMKRITWWPQAFLGLTFNFGALMGWTSVNGALDVTAFYLYAAGFFWTIGYDTIYALQDKEDDALVGIKSTARLFIEQWGIHPAIPCGVSYLIAMILLTMAIPYWGMIIPALHLVWQVVTLRQTDSMGSLRRFKSNRDFGFLVLIVILFLY